MWPDRRSRSVGRAGMRGAMNRFRGLFVRGLRLFGRLALFVAAALLFLAAFLVVSGNATPLRISVLAVDSWPMSVGWWLLLSFAAGLLVGYCIGVLRGWWRSRLHRRAGRESV